MCHSILFFVCLVPIRGLTLVYIFFVLFSFLLSKNIICFHSFNKFRNECAEARKTAALAHCDFCFMKEQIIFFGEANIV